MQKWFLLVLAALWSQGCVSKSLVAPQAMPEQKLSYDQGVAQLTSDKTFSVWLKVPDRDHAIDERLRFWIGVRNDTNASVNLTPDRIKVYVDGKLHPWLSHEALQEEANKNRLMGFLLVGIGALIDGVYASNDAPETRQETFQIQTLTPFGYRVETYTQEEHVSPLRDVLERWGLVLGVVDITTDMQYQSIKQVFRSQSLEPDQRYEGLIVLQKLSNPSLPHRIEVAVDLLGEQYRFGVGYEGVSK